MPADHNSIAAATTAATHTAPVSTTTTTTTHTHSTHPLTNPPPSRPISPLQQHSLSRPHHLHNTHFPSQTLYAPQPLPIRSPNPQLAKPHDPSSVLYPVVSSGRGFIPRGVRSPLSTDQMVTVANSPTGYTPCSVTVFPHGVKPTGPPMHSELLQHSLHMTRPPNLQYTDLGSAVGPGSSPIRGVPISASPKASPAIPDSSGYKDKREGGIDDTVTIIRDRKVKIKEDASLYALCRSWMRNGLSEECQTWQLKYDNSIKQLPKPLPAPLMENGTSNTKSNGDEDGQEEDEQSVEHLSTKDLLKRHVTRAKRIRARLREERLQRISRYRNRLRLLLPPPVEQLPPDAAGGT